MVDAEAFEHVGDGHVWESLLCVGQAGKTALFKVRFGQHATVFTTAGCNYASGVLEHNPRVNPTCDCEMQLRAETGALNEGHNTRGVP